VYTCSELTVTVRGVSSEKEKEEKNLWKRKVISLEYKKE